MCSAKKHAFHISHISTHSTCKGGCFKFPSSHRLPSVTPCGLVYYHRLRSFNRWAPHMHAQQTDAVGGCMNSFGRSNLFHPTSLSYLVTLSSLSRLTPADTKITVCREWYRYTYVCALYGFCWSVAFIRFLLEPHCWLVSLSNVLPRKRTRQQLVAFVCYLHAS